MCLAAAATDGPAATMEIQPINPESAKWFCDGILDLAGYLVGEHLR
jgi:hypothetical protein